MADWAYWVREWAKLCCHGLCIASLIGVTSLTTAHDSSGLRRVQYELGLLVEHVTSYVTIFDSNACPVIQHPILSWLTHQQGLMLHLCNLLLLRRRNHVRGIICVITHWWTSSTQTKCLRIALVFRSHAHLRRHVLLMLLLIWLHFVSSCFW